MTTATPSRPAPSRTAGPRPATSGGSSRSTTIDPFRLLRRHLIGLIAATLLGAILGGAIYFLLLRTASLYTSEVRFEVQPGIREVGDIGTEQTLDSDDVSRIAQTQIVLLTNREVLENALNDQNVRETKWFKQNYIDENGSPLVDKAVDELQEDLEAGVVRGTELFEVRWAASEPTDVPVVLNAIASAYMTAREARDNRELNENLRAFQAQLEDTGREIEALESEIKDFIREKGIQSLDDTRYSQAAMALRGLTSSIAEAENELNAARTAYRQTATKLEGRLQPAPEDIHEAEMDYAVTQHIRQVENLKVQLRAMRENYQEDHPAVVKAKNQLRAAEAEKEAKLDEVIKRNLNSRLQMLQNRVESLTGQLDDMEAEAEAQDATLRELTSEQSQYEAMNQRLQHLEEMRSADAQLIKEIKLMRLRKDASRVVISTHALIPRERSFPLPEVIIPLSVLVVLGLTVGVIFLRALTDQRVKSASDLAVLPGARILGVIPDLDDDPTKCPTAELVVSRYPNSVVGESYRQANTPILKRLDRAGHQTVVLMGGMPGAGTTTVASNMAAGFAASGRRVLVVDANFRRPRLAEVLGVDKNRAGLGDVLADAVTVDEAIETTEFGVSVMSAGTPASRIVERFNMAQVDSVVAELRSRYDFVIFDAPPAVVAGEPMMLANKLDAAVLIVRANQEHRGLVARLIGQLSDTPCELIGLVLNRPRGTAGGYFKKNFATMAKYASSS